MSIAGCLECVDSEGRAWRADPPAEKFACGLTFFPESIDSNLGKIGIDEQTNDNQVKDPREDIS